MVWLRSAVKSRSVRQESRVCSPQVRTAYLMFLPQKAQALFLEVERKKTFTRAIYVKYSCSLHKPF